MMLGKSVGPRGTLVGLLLLVACMHNVPQDAKTGEDGKIKSAKPMKLENGEATAKGVVTYPGGDRIDWKLLELPEAKRGTLDLTLSWQPPRPGLQLAFDVFDEWNTLVVSSKKAGKKKGGKTRSASISPAMGKYFIRVYAVGRGDAGKYKLAAEFKETVAGPLYDPLKMDIPDPPKLAAVPENEVGCDEFTFDIKNKACANICPAQNAPPGWPACKGKCPSLSTGGDINDPSCWDKMPCPPGKPDKKVKACTNDKWPPCPDKKKPDPENPNCPAGGEPVVGRVTQKVSQGGELKITISVGKDQGVQKSWKAYVVKGPDVSDAAVPGGDARIETVDKTSTTVWIKLTADQLSANPYVKFSPK